MPERFAGESEEKFIAGRNSIQDQEEDIVRKSKYVLCCHSPRGEDRFSIILNRRILHKVGF
jgi:hypothetical protein